MQTYKQVFQSAGTWQQATFGRFFFLVDTPNPVTVRLMSNGKVVYTATGVEAGFWTVPEEPFTQFEIDSDYAGGAIKVGVSQSDKGGYNRVGGKVDARLVSASGVINVPFKNVLQNIETTLAVANPGRASLRIWNNGTSPVFIGAPGLNLNDAAIQLAPGDLWVESDAPGATWVALHNNAAPQPLKVQEIIY